MEPKMPSPQLRPEQSGGYGVPSPSERFPQNAAMERGLETYQERAPEQHEQGRTLPPSTYTPTITLPPIASDDSATQQSSQAVSDTPLVANDDDLIEKEWVDKAKKIIAETKDDPFLRDQEVSRLQADYLRKRYGRELGDAA